MPQSVEEMCLEHKYEIERIKNHNISFKKQFDEIHYTLGDIKVSLNNISNTLIGNPMNNNSGIVGDLEDINKRLIELEKSHLSESIYYKWIKYAIGIVIGVYLTKKAEAVFITRDENNIKIESTR